MEHAIAFVYAVRERHTRLHRILRILQSEFGGPPKPGEGSAQVVGQVIERLAQDADMRRVLVEECIELTDKDGQLAAAMGRTDSRSEVAGLKDPAGCFGDFA